MAISKIQICNLALASLGEDSIRSFDENNKRARLCDIFYNITRDYLLSKFDWPFARTFTYLNEVIVEHDVPEGMRVFQLPNDCENPRDISPLGSRQKWYIQADKLYTNIEKVGLYYTKKEVNQALFSSTFSNLLALGISVRICPPITQDKQLAKDLHTQYNILQAETWESDANIGNNWEPDDDHNNDTFVYPDNLGIDLSTERE